MTQLLPCRRRLDQFELQRKIGGGYASTVYLAQCRASGMQVSSSRSSRSSVRQTLLLV